LRNKPIFKFKLKIISNLLKIGKHTIAVVRDVVQRNGSILSHPQLPIINKRLEFDGKIRTHLDGSFVIESNNN